MDFIPFDLFFSYWILSWAFLYYLVFFIYPKKCILELFSPILALIIGILVKFQILYMLNTWNSTTQYFTVIIIINLLVLITTWYISPKIKWFWNTMITIGFFALYTSWVYLRGFTISQIYQDMYSSMEKQENRTPLIHVYNDLLDSIRL